MEGLQPGMLVGKLAEDFAVDPIGCRDARREVAQRRVR
jgi:hypothetical protein